MHHLRLKKVLSGLCDGIRCVRKEKGWLFSALHLTSFHVAAAKHFADNNGTPFDFVAVNRQSYSSLTDYKEYVSEFVRVAKESWTVGDILKVLVSSILLDAYPLGMHGEDLRFGPPIFRD